MSRAIHEKAVEIFGDAVAMPAGERPAFIDSACNGDAALRAAVERLLDHDSGETFLDTPVSAMAMSGGGNGAADDEAADGDAIVAIGQYRVIRSIARGGMGEVFLAEQANPTREVAIKLLRSAVVGTGGAAMLEREAQLLGRLQHPGIARIYEAGRGLVVRSSGIESELPYVVMEYIEGETLDRYAATQTIDTTEAIRILRELVAAVEHAHQRGVIHRDLKPGNIIVDGSGRLHVLDFGVATVTGPPIGKPGTTAGTIAYMPPEQLLGRLDQVDTRSDLYAIGVIAFELLTGEPLHERSSSIDQAMLDRLKRDGFGPGERARFGELRARVGHDLAAVVARAANPDRERRYRSAGELADDLARVVEGRPTAAGGDSLVRTWLLLARRHRVGAAVVAAAVLLAVVGVVGLVYGLADAHRSARVATEAQLEAETEALHAQRMADFLQSSLYGVDPEEMGASVSLADAIDYATNRIHRDLADVPEVEADVRFNIGFVYRRHGRFADALEQVRASHRIRERLYGLDDPRALETAEELGYLAWIYKGDADEARTMLGSVLSALERRGEGDSASAAWIRIKLAVVLLAMDDPVPALAHLDQAEPLMVEHYGRVYAARTMRHRATALLLLGEPSRAVAEARAALELCRGADEQAYIEARCRMTLAEVLLAAGEVTEARGMVAEALEGFTQLLPTDHAEVAEVYQVLARVEAADGNPGAANDALTTALDIRGRRLAPGHPMTIEARTISAMIEAGRSVAGDEQLAHLERAFARSEHAFGADHRLSLELLERAVLAARDAGDDHTARRHQGTLDALRDRRAMRLASD